MGSLVETKSVEQRLAALWTSLLAVEQIGLDDDFFDLGGDSILATELQTLVQKEFGKRFEIVEMYECSTVRLQAEILQKVEKRARQLPAGVLALQPHGNRNNIFWLHYLSPNLAKVIGDDQPLLYVALTSEDFPVLGPSPTLQAIASLLLQKIFIAQAKGPYTLGGYCLGGILAYEIASQLRAAGHDVSLVVLVDPPNPSYIEVNDSPRRMLNYIGYAARRAFRLGLRLSMVYLAEHIRKFFARRLLTSSTRTEMGTAQRMIESAALKYTPKEYDGKVLLLLASDRPSYVNRLLEWKAVVPQDLHVQYVNAHHRDLLKPNNARSIANAIVSELVPPAATILYP
jgi:thioesterase domain-containing protein/acyl carrier protein